MQASSSKDARTLVQPAVQANKEHQYALKVYTERLEAELEHLDKLLATAEASEDEEEEVATAGGSILIPGAKRPRGLIPVNDLVSEESPLYHEAMRRQRYEEFTVAHPKGAVKAQELEALADAVRSENYRLYALQAQAQGLQPFSGLVDPPQTFINTNKHGIDWSRVAQKVSSTGASVQRTAKECEIRWLGERHPDFNDAQWSQAEVAKVRELVDGAREGQVDWVEIAQKLGTGRTPVDCMRHAIVRKTHSWNPGADKRLLEAVEIYGTDNWALVARRVSEDATAAQCQNRYQRTLDPTLKRGPWTPDEDERLKEAVAVFGHSWIDVAVFVEGRNNEQCRDRYQEYLNPSISKGKWTEEQDQALLKAVEQIGLGKWKEVSQVLNIGRTDNMCRIRYGTLMKNKSSSKTASPAPSTSHTSSEAPSQSMSTAPSRARTRHPSGQSTPTEDSASAQRGVHEGILVLHPDSYVPRLSGSAPAQNAKPKPRPRPRMKNPPAIVDPSSSVPVSSDPTTAAAATPSITTPQSETPPPVQEDVTQTGFKRLGSNPGDSPPGKRRRTEESAALDINIGIPPASAANALSSSPESKSVPDDPSGDPRC
ncbi:hypothetical protein BN946_scf185043.g52 [Trametes cinnabarina]|uniref:Uncharacterized protein n=1 Tax=Pycnoporus cinnabarinus TaxID=5643 RepID=A0A060SNI9_PYCCI|nr:hypothetical protein BN946_scf185043.g52 [Trametes cinnabarina]